MNFHKLFIVNILILLFAVSLINAGEVYADCTLISEDVNCYTNCSSGCQESSPGSGTWCSIECLAPCSGGTLQRARCYDCTPGSDPCGGSSCFTGETKIATPGGEKEIKDVKAGDEVKSFSEQTNQETTSVVEKIHEVTRSAYYKIRLKDGTEIKVTGEHPLYAIKKARENLTFWGYLKTESLTVKFLEYLQGKN